MRPDGFDALMQLLEDAGCWIKRGVQISIKPPGGKRFIRLDTVGTEYSEKALRLTLAGKHVHIPKQARSKMPHAQIELLINIEAKMKAGKGKGYGWEFLFLGANIDAVETAGHFGIDADRAVNYHSDSEGTALNYEVLSETICAVRCSQPLGSEWKKRIDEDYQRRK